MAAVAGLIALPPAGAEPLPYHQITPAQVEGLCPGVTLAGSVLGAPRSAQAPEFVNTLARLPASYAPFAQAELDLTDWSDRLAAITWRAASPDGDVNQRTMDAFRTGMAAAGWAETVQGDLMSPLGFDAIMFEKDLPTNLGVRRMLVEFGTPGALMLRCGDAELMKLDLAERDGKLAPGSQRPAVPALGPLAALPDDSACRDPAVQAAFSEDDRIDESHPVLQQLQAATQPASAAARAGERLTVWLRWKLLGSGKLDDGALWDIQDRAAAAPDGEAIAGELIGFLEDARNLMQARKARDRARSCRAFLSLLRRNHARDLREAGTATKVNAVLEAEAVRLGVGLD